MPKKLNKQDKILIAAKKLGIADIGEAEGFFASAEDEKNNIKTYFICSVCGAEARDFVQQSYRGIWCFRCEAVLYIKSKKRICEKLEISEMFTKEDRFFLKNLWS